MKTHTWNETFEERLVTYTQEVDGRFIVIEHVPARVIETPVYEFAAVAA